MQDEKASKVCAVKSRPATEGKSQGKQWCRAGGSGKYDGKEAHSGRLSRGIYTRKSRPGNLNLHCCLAIAFSRDNRI